MGIKHQHLNQNGKIRIPRCACRMDEKNWDISKAISRLSPYDDGSQDVSAATSEFLANEANVLVVGAGGLGCEILKCLALSGFRNITVIDMDTIDVSNLNRQFLFRDVDVGRAKADVAAEFINVRCRGLGVHVKSVIGKIQDMDAAFYSQFFIIIAGLDNIPARRWLNSTIFSLLVRDENGTAVPSSIKFLLDGGTEGFKGQARVIVPSMTACFECTLNTFPAVASYPLCTIAETPRLPEHCIEYAFTVLYDRAFPGSKFNADDDTDIQWVFQAASARAELFGISGVSKQLTKGVVKRIVPAVASTNGLIAAILVNEAFKIATYSNPVMSNYCMYMGQTGANSQTFAYERASDCLVCGDRRTVTLHVNENQTLDDLIQALIDSPQLRLTQPSIVGKDTGRVVFMQNPPTLRAQFAHKLPMLIKELVRDQELGQEIIVSDPVIRSHVVVRLQFG